MIWQFNVGYGWKSNGGACSAPTRLAQAGQPESGGALNGGDEAPDRRRSFEATKEGRGIVMRVPLEGGGRLVVELTPDEAAALGDELKGVTS